MLYYWLAWCISGLIVALIIFPKDVITIGDLFAVLVITLLGGISVLISIGAIMKWWYEDNESRVIYRRKNK